MAKQHERGDWQRPGHGDLLQSLEELQDPLPAFGEENEEEGGRMKPFSSKPLKAKGVQHSFCLPQWERPTGVRRSGGARDSAIIAGQPKPAHHARQYSGCFRLTGFAPGDATPK